jgi:hypothetical protein
MPPLSRLARALFRALHPLARAGRAALLAQLQVAAELHEVCAAVHSGGGPGGGPSALLLGPEALDTLGGVAAAWAARRPVSGPGAAGSGGQAAAEAVHWVLGARGVLLDALERVVAAGGQPLAAGVRRAAVGRAEAGLQLQAAEALAGMGCWDSAEAVLEQRRERLAQMFQLTRLRVAPELVLPGLALRVRVQAAKLAAAGPGQGAGAVPAAALQALLSPLADERQQAEGQPALVLQALLAQAQANAALAGQGRAEQQQQQQQRAGWASGAARALQRAVGLAGEGAAAAAAHVAAAHVQHALLCYQLALQEPAAAAGGGSGGAGGGSGGGGGQQQELPPLQQLEPDVQAALRGAGGPAAAAVASLLAALAASGGTAGEGPCSAAAEPGVSPCRAVPTCSLVAAGGARRAPAPLHPAPRRLAGPARGAHAAAAGAGLPGLRRRRRRARLRCGVARRAAGHLPALGAPAAVAAGGARGRRAGRAAAGGRLAGEWGCSPLLAPV